MHSKDHRNRTEESLIDMLESAEFKKLKSNLTFPVGRDLNGKWHFIDLIAKPSVLITGSPKDTLHLVENVLMPAIIYRSEISKLVVSAYSSRKSSFNKWKSKPFINLPLISHEDIAGTLVDLLSEAEKRLSLLKDSKKKNIEEYNKSAKKHIPHIILIIDSLSDITIKKSFENCLVYLLRNGKKVGIYTIISRNVNEKSWSYQIVNNISANIDFYYLNRKKQSNELRFTRSNRIGEVELTAPSDLDNWFKWMEYKSKIRSNLK